MGYSETKAKHQNKKQPTNEKLEQEIAHKCISTHATFMSMDTSNLHFHFKAEDLAAHPVPEALETEASVVEEELLDALVEPAAVALLQHQGQVPMVQGHHGLDVVLQQLVDQLVVELHALLVHVVLRTVRHHAGPRDGEAVVGHLITTEVGDVGVRREVGGGKGGKEDEVRVSYGSVFFIPQLERFVSPHWRDFVAMCKCLTRWSHSSFG